MNTMTAAAILFLLTGVLHVLTPVRFGSRDTTRGVAVFGVIYLILGVLLLLGTFSWTPIAALVLTLIGMTGAAVNTKRKVDPELNAANMLFIGIDVVIVVLLIISLFSG